MSSNLGVRPTTCKTKSNQAPDFYELRDAKPGSFSTSYDKQTLTGLS